MSIEALLGLRDRMTPVAEALEGAAVELANANMDSVAEDHPGRVMAALDDLSFRAHALSADARDLVYSLEVLTGDPLVAP
jgi:hypothetical protein